MIFGSKEQKTCLTVFLKHTNIYLLKKSRSSGHSQVHSEAYLCRQGPLLSIRLLCCPQHVDCLPSLFAVTFMVTRWLWQLQAWCLHSFVSAKKRGRNKRISSVKVLSFLYKKKIFPMSLPLDFFSYFIDQN